MTVRPARRSALALVGALMGCSAVPHRFSASPPAELVDDARPVPVPMRHAEIGALRDANVYVRRELVNAFEPRRACDARDVNALDDVPASSWFRGVREFDRPLRGYKRDGPPLPPLRPIEAPAASETPGARVIEDVRGLRYELIPEIPGRPAMRTGAAAAASRLLYGLGYETAETHVVTDGGARFAALRWPVGIDLGPTPIESRRDDDPNDRIDHRDRRTLRGLKLAAAWLDLRRSPARMLRDHYVGTPGSGHVVHSIVAVDGALGVDRYQAALRWLDDPDRDDTNFFLRLVSFGLSPKPVAYPPTTVGLALGLYEEFVDVEAFSPSPPFEPFDRMAPGDAYWMAKRIAGLPGRVLGRAVLAGKLPRLEQHALLRLLETRRAQVIAWGYDRVTPLEPGAVAELNDGSLRVALVDLAIHSGMTPAASSRYRVSLLDDASGEALVELDAQPSGPTLEVTIPAAVAARGYVLARILGVRGGHPLPRPLEVHLRPRHGRFAVVGVRH